jgi:hypothetical protein
VVEVRLSGLIVGLGVRGSGALEQLEDGLETEEQDRRVVRAERVGRRRERVGLAERVGGLEDVLDRLRQPGYHLALAQLDHDLDRGVRGSHGEPLPAAARREGFDRSR